MSNALLQCKDTYLSPFECASRSQPTFYNGICFQLFRFTFMSPWPICPVEVCKLAIYHFLVDLISEKWTSGCLCRFCQFGELISIFNMHGDNHYRQLLQNHIPVGISDSVVILWPSYWNELVHTDQYHHRTTTEWTSTIFTIKIITKADEGGYIELGQSLQQWEE